MSLDFSSYNLAPFKSSSGLITGNALSYFKKTDAPRFVKASINWANYPTLGVYLNLTAQQSTVAPLDKISALYVDNTGNPNSVYIKFPDTGYIVTVPPDSTSLRPVFTNALEAQIFCEATSSSPTETDLFFGNVFVNAFDEYQRPYAQTLLQGSSNANGYPTYLTPTVADQVSNAQISLTAGAVFSTMLAAKSSGRFIISSLQFCSVGLQTSAGVAVTQFTFQDIGGIDTIVYQTLICTLTQQIGANLLYNLSGAQLVLDATKNWGINFNGTISGTLIAGGVDANCAYAWITS